MSRGKAFIKSLWAVVPAALIFVGGGCSTLQVSTDYNRSADFAAYRTYSWLRVSASNQLWADRVRRNVNEQLQARGWMEVPTGGQAAVSAFAANRAQPSLETFYSGFGPEFGGWGWRGPGWGGGFNSGFATTRVVYTPIGSLVVDIFSAQDKRLLWRGEAEQVISGDPMKNERKLAHALNKMFQNFPPNAEAG